MANSSTNEDLQSLGQELAHYESIKKELLLSRQGQFVLIKDEEVIGFFSTEEAAYTEGISRLGNVPFLIKQIVEVDLPQTIPALFLGLLHADT